MIARYAERIRRRAKRGRYDFVAVVDGGSVLIGTGCVPSAPLGNAEDRVVLRLGIEQPRS